MNNSPLKNITKNFPKVLSKVWAIMITIITVASTVVGASQLGLNTNKIINLTLLALLTISLFYNIVFSVNQATKIKRIIFISPSSGFKPFYSELLEGLIRHTCSIQNRKFNLIPHLPPESFEPINNWNLLNDIFSGQYPADGVILISDDPDSNFERITSFFNNKSIPLVLLDVNFDLKKYDKRSRKLLPPFIGGDEKAGGAIAAEIMASYFGKKNISSSTVLIIKGAATGWERIRYKSFVKTLSKRINTAFIYSDPICYDRATARDACRIILKEHAVNKKITINGVFASNDDMAIGVKAAVLELSNQGYILDEAFGIVGYDGIHEMKELLASSDPYIIGSVDVKISEQAALCLKQILKSGRRNSRTSITTLINPKKLTRK